MESTIMTQEDRVIIEGLREKIDALNINLTKLMTLFGGGPGTWARCEQHTEKIIAMEKELSTVREKLDNLLLKIAGVCGAVAVIVFLVNLASPAIQKALGIVK